MTRQNPHDDRIASTDDETVTESVAGTTDETAAEDGDAGVSADAPTVLVDSTGGANQGAKPPTETAEDAEPELDEGADPEAPTRVSDTTETVDESGSVKRPVGLVDPNAPTLTDSGSWPEEGARPRPVTRVMPRNVGPYRVVSLLGEGGMGSVFLAEQKKPVERQVAIKLIRASLTSPTALLRFSAERQALARLAHPAIAQMYEAGTTDDGFPYFVMERVEGIPLTRYCDARQLGLEERLALFVDVCQGVEHAHRKGILHRDLKPTNILVAEVDGRPVPKIIDFGIAKAIDEPLTEATQLTAGGIGTPAYMSPESLIGMDVDTRTDVYALGIILYELVAGRRPFEFKGTSMPVIVRTIVEEEPTRPSLGFRELADSSQTRVARRRGLEPGPLQRRIEGDLDWIVGKALEKERDRRYGSATELAADVGRHLADEPVVASPPSARYRWGKFLRRNKAVVIAGALAVLALILGTVGTTLGMLRARDEATRANLEAERTREALLDAEQVTEFLVELFEVSDPREAGGESTTARQLLDRGAERIEGELADQPLRQARLMHTIGTIYDQLQVYPEAKRLVTAALVLRQQGLDEGHLDLGDSHHRLAVIDRQLAEYEAAEAAARKSLEVREAALGPDHPEVGETLRELAVVLYLAGRYDEAEPVVRRSLAIAEDALGRDDPAVAFSLETLGNLLKDQGRCDEAIAGFERALAIREASFGANDPRLAYALNNLASCYGEGGRYQEARPLFERALAIQEKTLGAESTAVAMGRTNLGIVYRSIGELDAAEEALSRARDDLAAALGDQHPLVANAGAELGVLLGQQGRYAEGEAELSRALEVWTVRPGPDHPVTAWAHWGLANVLRDAGRLDDAEPHYARALEVRQAVLPADHPDLAQTRGDYAEMLRRAGRDDEAKTLEATTSADVLDPPSGGAE